MPVEIPPMTFREVQHSVAHGRTIAAQIAGNVRGFRFPEATRYIAMEYSRDRAIKFALSCGDPRLTDRDAEQFVRSLFKKPD